MGISFASGALRRWGRRAALVATLGLAALAGGQAQAAFPERTSPWWSAFRRAAAATSMAA